MKKTNDCDNTLTQVMGFTVDKAIALSKENGVADAPIVSDGVTVVPISKVSIGFAGGGADVYSKAKEKNPAGSGVKIAKSPLSFVVIQDGQAKVLSATAPSETAPIKVSALISQAKDLFAKIKEKKAKKTEE